MSDYTEQFGVVKPSDLPKDEQRPKRKKAQAKAKRKPPENNGIKLWKVLKEALESAE